MPIQKITRTKLPGAIKAHAIIVAINRYDKIGAHLQTPKADAEALKETLINYQGFAEENVHTCYDPTKTALETFLKNIQQGGSIQPKDGLLFYYAGHGLAGDIDGAGAAGYLMPSDVSFSIAELSKNETLIKMEWLFEQLEAFECHHTLAIMDCCFAGAFRRISRTRATMGLGLRPMSKERFNRYQEKRAWQVLASAGPAEKAADLISERGEATSKNSPFAEALVAALSGQARPDFKPAGKNLGDGILTTHELFIYLHDEVEQRTRKAEAFKPQNPDLFPMGKHDGGQFIFCDPRHPKNSPDWDERKRKNPYKGLEQYDLEDADYYFGRTSDVENLRSIMGLAAQNEEDEKQKSPTLLVLSGPSGSGKSSLVKAGLLPAYQRAGYEIFQFRPGDRPWSLKKYQHQQWEEVMSDETNPFRFVPPKSLDQIPSSSFFGERLFYLNAAKPQVLYIDQFEELFNTCSTEEQATLNSYLKELLEAALAGQLHIIISMRSDFEWQLEVSEFGKQFWDKEQAYYRFFKLYRLATLGLDDLRSALVNPATLFAYEFAQDEEGDLTDAILEDLNYLPSALPLLSYTMQEMVTHTTSSERLFKRASYSDELGGVSGALSKRMQLIYDGFGAKPASEETSPTDTPPTAKQELLRHVFLRMVSLSDGEYTRRRVYRDQQFDELRFAEDNHAVKEILDALRAANLISTGGEAGIRYEELIHDSLINTWTTGKQWINDFGKENLSLQRELWKAVMDSARAPEISPRGYEKEQSDQERSLVDLNTSFSRLWDSNPKLLQIIKQVADASLFLLEDKDNVFVNEMLAETPEEDKAAFLDFWHECHSQQTFPDLNSLILSGNSGKVLTVLLEQGKHGLNLAEVNFIQQSWTARIEDVMKMKRERDEAKAAFERTTTEMIEASWKTGVYLEANPERNKIGTDWNTLSGLEGVRSMYAQLKMIMSLEKVKSLSPIPVFLKGPHIEDYNIQSDEFGYYNPAFLAWAKTRVIPAKNNPVLRQLTQPFYNTYMRDMARSYYIALLHLQKHPALFEARVKFYANGGTLSTGDRPENFHTPDGTYAPPVWYDIQKLLGASAGHYFYTGIDFWARRNIDTTDKAFAEILYDLLTTYDQDWLNTGPDGDWVYAPPS
ncbi:caspase domain-containing protein [Lewinella sp. LCG006]|uniref:caspase family protein n=1 Tax=Lewinella sp. LCG006 TaxID=3231911 RepID=UPI00345F9211